MSKRKSGHTYIEDMTFEGFVHGVYAIVNPQIGTQQDGNPFLKCLLRDSTGSASGRMWRFEDDLPEIIKHGFVRIEGAQEEYQGRLQIKIKEIWSYKPDSEELTYLLPSTQFDVEEMFKEVAELIRTLEHPAAKELGEAYLDDTEMMKKFRDAPAAKMIHHAWIGGLLEHTLQLMKLADVMLPRYPRLNRDIILLALFIHDLGKIEELSWSGQFEYTREGNLIGHIAMGAMWLEEKAVVAEKNLGESLPDGFLTVMQHIVLSHHGQLEYGAAKLPSTPEAIFVSKLDILDAHTQTALDAARPLKQSIVNNGAFTERLFALSTKLYRRDPLRSK